MRKTVALLALVGALATVLLVAALPAVSATNSGIINGSFQTCDLTGWMATPATNAAVGVTGGGYDGFGACQGYISTGSSGPDVYSYLSNQQFWATAGTKVTVYAWFGNDCGFDYAYVVFDGYAQGVSCGIGWGLYGRTTTYTGWHQFYAEASNGFDTLISSTLYIDTLKASGLHKV